MSSVLLANSLPVFYGSQRYQSKLEAKWAIFFDTLKLSFSYEPKGFRLSSGQLYIPDFWIPAWDRYIEIKPFRERHANAWMKCIRLQQESGIRVFLISGEPQAGRYIVRLWSERERRAFQGIFGFCSYCGSLHLQSSDWSTPLVKNCERPQVNTDLNSTRLSAVFAFVLQKSSSGLSPVED